MSDVRSRFLRVLDRGVEFGDLSRAEALDLLLKIDEWKGLRDERDRLVAALDRTEANFVAAVDRKPVRDMAETLAENRAARETTGGLR